MKTLFKGLKIVGGIVIISVGILLGCLWFYAMMRILTYIINIIG